MFRTLNHTDIHRRRLVLATAIAFAALVLTVAAAGPFTANSSAHSATAQVLPPAQEELLGRVDSGSSMEWASPAFSPDLRRVAWREEREKKLIVVTKWALMVNGKTEGEYSLIGFTTFSPDSQRLARAVRVGKQWLYAVDNEQDPAADDLSAAAFSPDSRHLAYAVKRNKMWTMTIDGQPVGPEPIASSKEMAMHPRFSPDGRRLAYYRYSSKKGTAVVLDGKEGPYFDQVFGLVFSPDSRRLAYVGVRFKPKTLGTVVLETQQGPVFQGLPPVVTTRPSLSQGRDTGPSLFFEGGQFLGLQANALGTWLGVNQVTREFGPRGMGVSAPVFSRDGQSVAYAARRGTHDEVMIIDGEPGPQFEAILTLPAFNPESGLATYLAMEEKRNVVEVVDDKKGRAVPFGEKDNFAAEVRFSPDGQRVAYVLGDCNQLRFASGGPRSAWRRVVLDGNEVKKHYSKALTDLRFSPDGRHLAYVVYDIREAKRDKAFVVLDAQEGKPYDEVFLRSLRFTGPEELVYVAREGRDFYRVVQRLPSQVPPRLCCVWPSGALGSPPRAVR